jgi:hypothetical protein
MAVGVYGKMEVILVTGVQWAAAAVEDINYCTITEVIHTEISADFKLGAKHEILN